MMMKTKTLIFFLFLLPFCLSADAKSMVEEKAKAWMEKHDISAMTVLLIGRENHQKFQVTFAEGHLSKKSVIPVNPYSIFRLGPLTQLFTAEALAYYVQEGRVSLNDPISKFLPRSLKLPTYQGQEITIGD